MSYGKIHSSYWTDEKIQALSDAAKLLGAYFLSSPHRNAIGCARIPDPYIAADLGWTAAKVQAAVAELEAIGFITREPSGWTLINNLMKYDPIRGAKAALGALRLTFGVPRSGPVYAALHSRLAGIIEGELKAYGDECERAMHPPSMGDSKEARSPDPSPDHTSTTPRADARVSEREIDREFAEFWSAYPRREGRGDALKAFRAARQKASAAEILKGARRYAAARAGEDGQYTKTPGPWLRAEKWLDEPPAPGLAFASKPRSNGHSLGGAAGPIDTSSEGPMAALAAENRRRNKLGLPPMNAEELAAWKASQEQAAA